MSDVFLIYLSLVTFGLASAWIVLAVLSWGFECQIGELWSVYRSWLVMIPLTMLCIYLGRVGIIGLVTALMMLAYYELARATNIVTDRTMLIAVLLLITCTGGTALLASVWGTQGAFLLFLSLPVYAVALLFVVPVLRNEVQGQLRIVSLSVVGYMYLGWMFGHLCQLANSIYAEGYVLFLLFSIGTMDIAAFTFGKLFGRHQLRSAISPNKTVEGALGALCVSMTLPWLLYFSFPDDFGTKHLILTGLIVGIGGQLGDLVVSLVKRDLAVKDMGAAIPGHGGVLDRVDSLVFSSPLFVHFLNHFGLL